MNEVAKPDSQGCLLVVATYADLAGAIEPIVATAAARIASSPMLGDLIEIRYVSAGLRPAEPERRGDAISRLVIDLTCPATGASENYFALAVIDQSASSVSELLADCAADPVIARLGTKTRGFAIVDDREPARSADIVLSPPGGWTKKALTDALWRYANQLLTDIASTDQRGLALAQLAGIRADDDRIPAPRSKITADDPMLDLRPASPAPDQAADDHLEERQAERGAAGQDQPEPAASEPGGARPAPGVEPRQRFSWPPTMRWPGSRGGASLAQPGQQVGAQAGQPPAAKRVFDSPRAVLLCMSIFGGSSVGEHDDWRRARSVLLAIDERIGATPALGYRVRAFRGADDRAHSALRPAGQLSKRDLRRPDRSLDFAPLLDAVLTTLTRDVRKTRHLAVTTARPAVIFFPVTAPLADVVSMRAYTELTSLALVLWIASEQVSKLMSPDFTTGAARTFVDYPDVSEEVADLLVANATVPAGVEATPAAEGRDQARV